MNRKLSNMRVSVRLVSSLLCFVGIGVTLFAADDSPARGPTIGETQVVRMKTGVVLSAVGGNCPRLVALVPVPIDWPEQTVKIVERDISPAVRKTSFRD